MPQHAIYGLCATLLLFAGAARGDDPAAEGEAAAAAKGRLAEMQRQAAEYDVRTAASTPTTLTLHPEPILRWDNPISGVKDGTVYLWADGRRPLAIFQVFLNRDGIWIHEFQQLSDSELVAKRDEAPVWTPKGAAFESERRGDAGEPAETPAARLRQMRAIASEYVASVRFRNNIGGITEPVEFELRLLPRPIYRYGDPDSDVIDCGLFAFVQGTNPEVLLIVEARRGDSGTGEWHCGFAPMSGYAVEAARGEEAVWSQPDRLMKKQPTDPFFALSYGPESP